MPRELGLFSFKRRLKEKLVVVFCGLVGGQRENRAGIFWDVTGSGRRRTPALAATWGNQTRLWKNFFTLAENTEKGAQRCCAISIPGDAHIQTAQALGKLALFGAGGWTR